MDLPTVRIEPRSDTVIRVGETITLNCTASSEEPEVRITWTAVADLGIEIPTPSPDEKGDGNSLTSSLTVMGESGGSSMMSGSGDDSTMSGAGGDSIIVYTCTAINRRGETAESATVFVML